MSSQCRGSVTYGSSFCLYQRINTVRGQRVSEAATLGRVARSTGVSRLRWRAWPRLTPYLLLAPSAVFLIGFTYWPVLQVVAGSFTVRGFGATAHAGLGNYARLFADPH